MKYFISLLLLFQVVVTVSAQVQERNLKIAFSLPMPSSVGQTNGTAVAWHPGLKRYMVFMEHESASPMAVFDANGSRVSDEKAAAGMPVYGAWYDKLADAIAVSGSSGWAVVNTDRKGNPSGQRMLFNGSRQPSPKATASYDLRTNTVYYLKGARMARVSAKNGQTGEDVMLYPGQADAVVQKEGEDEKPRVLPKHYNQTSGLFTGIGTGEFALLNTTDRVIELYSKADGLMTQRLRIPENAPVSATLNFSYANGLFFLYDTAGRRWIGLN